MAKKITAPKTYDPGKGRPKEHLAYLNEREMAYLRSINGNNMERGPRGLPSFPPDDSIGSSSRASGSRGSSGGSRGPGGPSGPNSSASGSRSSSQPKTSTTGGYRGPSSPMGGQGASFKSNSSAASYNKDVGLKNSLSNRDTSKTVKNSPAVRNDGVTGFKAQALGVKPVKSMGTTKQTQPAPAKFGPANRDMEINRNLDKIKADFYNTDPDYQKALSNERAKVAQSRAGVGLLGAGISPRDTLSAPARTAPSTGMTQGEWTALKDKYNPISASQRIAGGIADLAGRVYNDPIGTANRAIDSFGQYAKNAYNTIGAAATSSDPDVLRAAAEKAAEIGLNYGVMGSAASAATGVPRDALGSLAVGRSTADKSIKQMFDSYDAAVKKGATPEQAFYESQKYAPSYAGGVVDIISEIPKSPNQPVRYSQAVEIDEPFEIRSSGIARDAVESIFGRGPIKGVQRYDEVFKQGPVNASYPGIGNMPVYRDPTGVNKGYAGYYSSAAGYQPGFKPISSPSEKFNALKYGSTAIQAPVKRGVASKIMGVPDTFRRTAAHEGQHRVANMDERARISNPFPQGTNPDYQAYLVRDALAGYKIHPMGQEEVNRLAWDRYFNNPGEYYARQAERFLGRPVAEMREYSSRFGNMTSDELNDMMRYGISEP